MRVGFDFNFADITKQIREYQSELVQTFEQDHAEIGKYLPFLFAFRVRDPPLQPH